jgi:arylsulfatase A
MSLLVEVSEMSASRLSRCLGTALLVAAVAGVEVRSAENAPRPNIVILYADDMGVGDVAAANPDSKIPTPSLDRLAREGTHFTDAHSSSGICTPSRYALLHGRYHWRKFHDIVHAFGQPVLDAERLTIAEMLAGEGYATACIGKWHLGWDWNAIRVGGGFDWSKQIPGGPLDHGFDFYFGDDVPNFPPYTWFENDRVLVAPTVAASPRGQPAEGGWEARPGPAVEDWDFHEVMPTLTRKAVEWIGRQKKDKPFFLYFAFTSPHTPIVPAAEFKDRSQADGYGDFVCQTDASVGAVLDALAARGFTDDTIVIFTADNGPEHYAYERFRRCGHRSMGPLRGVKRDLWEGGHRVPFIVRWPGHVPAGRIEDGLISQIDLYATLAAIVAADIPVGSAEDSLDQRACLTGVGPSTRDTLIHNTNARAYAIRHGDWVLIDAPTGAVSRVPRWYDEMAGYESHGHAGELYNLRDDLPQKHSRFAEEPDRVADLRRRLRTLVGNR